jgi:hypothetical protein
MVLSDSQRLRHITRPLGELIEERIREFTGYIEPLKKRDASLFDDWINENMGFHANIRIWPSPSHEDSVNFRAYLHRLGDASSWLTRDFTVPRLSEFDRHAPHGSKHWPDLAVLIHSGKLIQNGKGVVSCPSVVRLIPTNDCDICSPYTRQFARKGSIERRPLSTDGKIDVPLLTGLQIAGATALHESPRDVIETTSVVVDYIAKPQAPMGRQILDGCDVEGDAMALSMIFGPYAVTVCSFGVEGLNGGIKIVRAGYTPTPFEPCAIEQAVQKKRTIS